MITTAQTMHPTRYMTASQYDDRHLVVESALARQLPLKLSLHAFIISVTPSTPASSQLLSAGSQTPHNALDPSAVMVVEFDRTRSGKVPLLLLLDEAAGVLGGKLGAKRARSRIGRDKRAERCRIGSKRGML